MKCMKSSKCSGKCGDCEDCGDLCDEEKGLIKEKEGAEESGWFDSLAEVRMFKLKVKRNRKLSNYERLKHFIN